MHILPFTPGVRSTGARPKRPRQVRRHLAMLAVAIAASGLLACEEQELSRGIVIGKIDFDDPAWPLPQIPETATVGVPLEIAVWTGGSGCYEYAWTAGGVDGLSATVIPTDIFIVGGCSTDPEFPSTQDNEGLREPGTAEITLWYNDGGPIRREDHNDEGRRVHGGGVGGGVGTSGGSVLTPTTPPRHRKQPVPERRRMIPVIQQHPHAEPLPRHAPEPLQPGEVPRAQRGRRLDLDPVTSTRCGLHHDVHLDLVLVAVVVEDQRLLHPERLLPQFVVHEGFQQRPQVGGTCRQPSPADPAHGAHHSGVDGLHLRRLDHAREFRSVPGGDALHKEKLLQRARYFAAVRRFRPKPAPEVGEVDQLSRQDRGQPEQLGHGLHMTDSGEIAHIPAE